MVAERVRVNDQREHVTVTDAEQRRGTFKVWASAMIVEVGGRTVRLNESEIRVLLETMLDRVRRLP